jgi:hypothetical protein
MYDKLGYDEQLDLTILTTMQEKQILENYLSEYGEDDLYKSYMALGSSSMDIVGGVSLRKVFQQRTKKQKNKNANKNNNNNNNNNKKTKMNNKNKNKQRNKQTKKTSKKRRPLKTNTKRR